MFPSSKNNTQILTLKKSRPYPKTFHTTPETMQDLDLDPERQEESGSDNESGFRERDVVWRTSPAEVSCSPSPPLLAPFHVLQPNLTEGHPHAHTIFVFWTGTFTENENGSSRAEQTSQLWDPDRRNSEGPALHYQPNTRCSYPLTFQSLESCPPPCAPNPPLSHLPLSSSLDMLSRPLHRAATERQGVAGEGRGRVELRWVSTATGGTTTLTVMALETAVL